jgi:hypothetical protein
VGVRPDYRWLWRDGCDDRHVGLHGDEPKVIKSAHVGGR